MLERPPPKQPLGHKAALHRARQRRLRQRQRADEAVAPVPYTGRILNEDPEHAAQESAQRLAEAEQDAEQEKCDQHGASAR
jgi:hypothetical protein